MADLEQELADLLDDAPLLPEDDDEGSGVDFVPPPNLSAPLVEANAPPSVQPTPVITLSDVGLPTSVRPTPVIALADRGAPAVVQPPALPPRSVDVPPSSPPPLSPRPAPELREFRSAASDSPAVPAVGKGGVALVTTVLVAVALIVGNLLTWPETRGAAVPSVSLRADTHSVAGQAPRPGAAPAQPNLVVEPQPQSPLPASPAASSAAGPPAFAVVDMLTALAPVGIEAGRCRHTGEKKGRAYVRVDIAAGGAIESVFPGHAYKDSETGACIERKLRAAKLPAFSGQGGSVVLPIDLR